MKFIFIFLIGCTKMVAVQKIEIPQNPFNVKNSYKMEKFTVKSCDDVYTFIELILADREYLISEINRISNDATILAKRLNGEKIQ